MKDKTLKISLEGKPVYQKRPRLSNVNGFTRVYDSQKGQKKADRLRILRQLKNLNIEYPITGNLSIDIDFHMGGAKKRKDSELEGMPKPIKPDVDNLSKYYLDVMNELVYQDDRMVTTLTCRKLYSHKEKVDITIKEDLPMVNEHAICYKNQITFDDLSYIVKKANKLGLANRELNRCFTEKDEDGTHLFFECEGLKKTFLTPPEQDIQSAL